MKTVLITGAGGGIGSAVTERFAAAGYEVYAGYCKSKEKTEELCRKTGAVPLKIDVRDGGSVREAFRVIGETSGGVNVLVNNAGVASQRVFQDITDAEWDETFAVNVRGAFLVTRAAVPYMISRKCGRIINVSSVWGMVGGSCEVHYSASKAALIGMTKALAKELGPSGITVNCVCPGVIDTKMIAALTEEDRAALAAETPLCRLGTPDDAAGAIQFLASDDAKFITGGVIAADGGFAL